MSFRFSPGRGEEGGAVDFFVKCNFADRAFEFLHSRICGRAVIGQSRRKLAQQELLLYVRKTSTRYGPQVQHLYEVKTRKKTEAHT